MPQCNIVIDGNYIAHSEYGIFSNYGKTSNSLSTIRGQANFISGLANKLFHLINKLPKGGQIVFVSDSRSWRKEFYDGYKASREDKAGNKGIMDRDSKEIFYRLMEEFCVMLNGVGIKTSRVAGAEGDDLIFHWAKHFNDKGENVCIISGDQDMIQCVRGPVEPWTVLWTPKSNASRLFCSPSWQQQWLDSVRESVFEFSVQSDQESFLSMIRDMAKRDYAPEIVEPHGHIFKKILIGDDGDDVPSSWTVYLGDDESVRLTPAKADKVMTMTFEQFKLNRSNAMSRWDEPGFKDFVAGAILRVMKEVDGAEERKKVIANLDRNASLVWLNEDMLPYNLNQQIKENIESSFGLTQERHRWNRKALLAGTKYSEGTNIPKGMDPLSMIFVPEE